jgi:hypothetical protein
MQSESKVNVLLVDDHPENLIALDAILSGLGQNLVKAQSGTEALKCLLEQDFAVILLDVQMPGMDGFETASLIRQRERSRLTPIIFLTAFSTSDTLKFKGYSLGAVDYLLKPIEPEILTSKVSVFVDLYQKSAALKRQTLQLAAINAELRQSEERFRSLSACSPVGIFLFNTEGQCTYTNPRCQAICGFTLEASLGKGWTNFLYDDDRDRALSKWAAYVQSGQEFSDECRFQASEGTIRWTHIRSSPMFSDQGEPMGHVGTVEDMTERKQAEAARAQVIREQVARQQAESANRMKDEFLAILSHELRTPLNAMLGWTRLLLTKKFDESTTIRALETIERNAKSQAQLVEDILDVSLIIRGKLRLQSRPVNVVPVIEAVLEMVQPTAEAKPVHLETDLDPSADLVFADPERLRQIIWNLLTNAIKFTPEGGRVQVRLAAIDPELHSGESTAPADSQRVAQLQVIDTGVGIEPEFLPYVFDRFRQADSTTTRSYGGLGLGLAIVRHLVELHGGTIQAASEGLNKGATFTVCLPLWQEQHHDENGKVHAAESAITPIATSTSKPPQTLLTDVQVLVVEDNLDTREFIAVALQQSGAAVTAVDSVREAMAVIATSRPHVLVSDIAMPEEDGYDLISHVQQWEAEQGEKIPAIALTAHAKQEEKQKALAAGFQLHLPKPVEPAELVAGVARLVGRTSVNPAH